MFLIPTEVNESLRVHNQSRLVCIASTKSARVQSETLFQMTQNKKEKKRIKSIFSDKVGEYIFDMIEMSVLIQTKCTNYKE